MKITRIRTTPVAVPFVDEEWCAFGVRRGNVSVVVELDTDEGIVGLGEAAAYPSADAVVSVLRAVEPLLLGEDPRRIERVIKRMDVVGTWHHTRWSSPVLGAVESACWDIVGKACGEPLVNLFGGPFHDVEYFHYVGSSTPEGAAASTRHGVAAGFHTFYLKVGSARPADDIARVAAVRDAGGPEIGIRVDANEAWSPGAAVRIIRAMERYELELVEQPVSGRNLDEMAYVRSRIDTPTLANEASWTRDQQLDVIAHNAADVLSVDNQMDGGLLNLKRSAGIAEAAGLPVLKHSLGELGVAVYAALHVLASTPNFLYANQSYASLLAGDVIAGGPPTYVDGCLTVPDAPGIGVELDKERVAEYADLYQKDGETYAYYRPDALASSPRVPKL